MLLGAQLFKTFPAFYWNPKIHYHIHTIPPLIPILCKIIPAHTLSSLTSESILIISSHLQLICLSDLFPPGYRLLYSISVRSILMLFSFLCLDLLSSLFPSASVFPYLVSLRSSLLLSFQLQPAFPNGLLLTECEHKKISLEFHGTQEAKD